MNLTKPSHIGWNASDQKLEVRWSVLRKVHHFRRETLSSGISRVYWNSRYLREESVPVDFKKTFSLQFQITELLNEENHCYLLFTLDDLGQGFHLAKQSSLKVIMSWFWRNLIHFEINCTQLLSSTNIPDHFWFLLEMRISEFSKLSFPVNT